MAVLALKVLDKSGKTICVSSGEDYVSLVCTAEYQEGDRIVLETSEKNIHVFLQVDDAMGRLFAILLITFPMRFLSVRNAFAIHQKFLRETGIICMRESREMTRYMRTGIWH